MQRVLIIKYGALGDIFQAFGAFSSLRHAFPGAHITLLTRPAYKELMQYAPWFDDILCDDRLPVLDPASWPGFFKLYQKLQSFDMVFDLQNARRTHLYFHCLHFFSLLGISRLPLWAGQVRGAIWCQTNPQARMMHTLNRQDDQLRAAGLVPMARPYPVWLTSFGPVISGPYVVLVPGAAPHRPRKLWPARRFAALAAALIANGLKVVLVGDVSQKLLAQTILNQIISHEIIADSSASDFPVLNLVGKTSLTELAGLISRARFVLGNDTGPLHVAAAMGTDFVTLFSDESDPRRTAPVALDISRNGRPCRGYSLQAPDIAQISNEKVLACLKEWGLLS